MATTVIEVFRGLVANCSLLDILSGKIDFCFPAVVIMMVMGLFLNGCNGYFADFISGEYFCSP